MWKKLIPKKSFYFKNEKLNSSEMFREMLSRLNSFAKILGANAFTPNYTPLNPIFVTLLFYVVSLTFEQFYSIYRYRNDTGQMILCIITLPSIIQSYVRVYSFIVNRSKLLNIFSFVEEFHKNYNSFENKKVMEEAIMNCCNLCLVLSLIMTVAGVLIIFYPVIYYLIVGHKILHFYGLELMFLDWKTPIGYTLNFINCSLTIVIFIISTILVCIDISICVLNSFAQFNVLRIYLNHLDDLALSKRNEENSKKIKEKIKDIVNLHNFLSE